MSRPGILALAAFIVAFGLSALRIGQGAPDFYVFWAAARHWRAPYDPAVVAQLQATIHLTGIWPFAYPPSFLLLAWPFAQLPLTLAYPLWTGLSAAAFVFAGAQLVRPVWAAAALFVAPPVFIAAELGQTSLIVGAAAISAWLIIERRPALAGVLLAFAACIKPQAMILAPLVLWGRWRSVTAMTTAGVGICAASLVFGVERWIEWSRALAAFQALAPQAERINPSALISGPVWAVGVALLGFYLAWRRKDLAGLVGGTLCVTPYAHAYDLAPLAPLAAAWLFDPKSHGWGRTGAGAALLSGMIATPAAALALVVALTAMETPWPKRWSKVRLERVPKKWKPLFRLERAQTFESSARFND
jgi:hypothetical protein